jgi:outer membrane protein assembly factor BamD
VQEERYNLVINYADQFSEKYPSSKYLKEVQQFKKDSQNGIVATKKVLAEAMSNQKLAKKIAKKDTATGEPPSAKVNTDKKLPN